MDPKFNRKDFTHNSNIETSSMFICTKILHTWTLAQDHVILLNPLQTYKSGHLSLLINHIIFDNLYFWLYLVTSRSMLCGLLFFRERERDDANPMLTWLRDTSPLIKAASSHVYGPGLWVKWYYPLSNSSSLFTPHGCLWCYI